MSKINEVLKNLFEGHDGEISTAKSWYQKDFKNEDELIKRLKDRIAEDKEEGGDFENFRGVKSVGDVTEGQLDKLATKYEDDYIVVGKIDGEFYIGYSRRS